jgi:hypothetical protein
MRWGGGGGVGVGWGWVGVGVGVGWGSDMVMMGHDGQNWSVLARLEQFTSSWVSCGRFRYCRKGQEGS